MHGGKGSARRQSVRRGRLVRPSPSDLDARTCLSSRLPCEQPAVLAAEAVLNSAQLLGLAVLLVIGYGFYIQTRDFHQEGGFRSHRKALEKTEQNFMQVSKKLQREAEQLSSASLQKAASGLANSTGPSERLQAEETVTKAREDLATAKDDIQGVLDQSIHALEQHLSPPTAAEVQRQENVLQGLVNEQELRIDEGTGYRSLPKLPDPSSAHNTAGARQADLDVSDTEESWRERQDAVRTAAKETWAVYEEHAMGADELRPLTLTGKATLGGMGANLVDSLDTLWMLGLKDEFERARTWVATNLTFEAPAKLSLFETTIRFVGGLLSAYDLTADSLFLDRAKQLVDILLPVFATSGIPNNVVYINQGGTKKVRSSQLGRAAIAEFGTIQVEFAALSQRTGNYTYGERAEEILTKLHDTYQDKALLPVWFNRRTGKFAGSNLYTVGAMGDSYFEYLLKLWLLHRKRNEAYRERWERATDEILDQLVAISPSGLTFVGQRRNVGKLVGKMEHLACYLPGNIALGVSAGAVSGAKGRRYMEAAANLTYTCWQMYERTATGLGLDHVVFKNTEFQMPTKGSMNMLRPETIESLFYMWRVTRESKYRVWGWKMFEAFRKHSRTPEGAYACVVNVNEVPVRQQDGMETFWLAETLKYLWLLFGSDDLLSLEEWVLNSEAHPLKIDARAPIARE